MAEPKRSERGRLPGGGAPKEAALLGSYLGNLAFALAVLLWLGVLKAPWPALLLPLAGYAALRTAAEGRPPFKNPYDLRALDRAARTAKVSRLFRLYAGALAGTTAALFLLARLSEPGLSAKLVATLAPLGIAALHGAVLLLVGRLALRIELLERAAREKTLSYGPRATADGRTVNLVHNPSETLH